MEKMFFLLDNRKYDKHLYLIINFGFEAIFQAFL